MRLFRIMFATALAAATTATTATTTAATTAKTTTKTTTKATAKTATARLDLPAPTGPYAVGTTTQRLVDDSRHDPWVTAQPYRELMVSVFYPAGDTAGRQRAPQMSAAAAKHFDESLATPVHQGWNIPAGKVDWGATMTHAYTDAPARAGRTPVVLYSPGLGDPRTLGTTLAEELASRGYAVVTIDHTYDASEVEFPGGRVEPFRLPLDGDPLATLKKVMSVRVADTRFVLDRLPSLLPDGLTAGRIGMFGQSAGGFTALQTMHDDARVAAAADLDGTVGFDQDDGGPGLSTLAEQGLRKPFLLMGSQASDHHTVRSWEALWDHSKGPHWDLHLRGSQHHSYTDMESLVPQLTTKIGLSAEAAYGDVGWATPARTVAAERTYLTAFFDRFLRGRDTGLLGRPSAEVTFVR